MSDSGFLLMSTRPLDVGQILDFQCELQPGKHLKCKLQVKHASDGGIGTRITEIDAEGRKLCQSYLQEHYSKRLEGTR